MMAEPLRFAGGGDLAEGLGHAVKSEALSRSRVGWVSKVALLLVVAGPRIFGWRIGAPSAARFCAGVDRACGRGWI